MTKVYKRQGSGSGSGVIGVMGERINEIVMQKFTEKQMTSTSKSPLASRPSTGTAANTTTATIAVSDYPFFRASVTNLPLRLSKTAGNAWLNNNSNNMNIFNDNQLLSGISPTSTKHLSSNNGSGSKPATVFAAGGSRDFTQNEAIVIGDLPRWKDSLLLTAASSSSSSAVNSFSSRFYPHMTAANGGIKPTMTPISSSGLNDISSIGSYSTRSLSQQRGYSPGSPASRNQKQQQPLNMLNFRPKQIQQQPQPFAQQVGKVVQLDKRKYEAINLQIGKMMRTKTNVDDSLKVIGRRAATLSEEQSSSSQRIPDDVSSRVFQLEELLRQEMLISEEWRSQVGFLKQELLRSVSVEGIVSLFEEAHIAALDERVDIVIQLKRIQQKLEEDVEKSEGYSLVNQKQFDTINSLEAELSSTRAKESSTAMEVASLKRSLEKARIELNERKCSEEGLDKVREQLHIARENFHEARQTLFAEKEQRKHFEGEINRIIIDMQEKKVKDEAELSAVRADNKQLSDAEEQLRQVYEELQTTMQEQKQQESSSSSVCQKISCFLRELKEELQRTNEESSRKEKTIIALNEQNTELMRQITEREQQYREQEVAVQRGKELLALAQSAQSSERETVALTTLREMQKRSDFFSGQVVAIAQKLKIIEDEDDAATYDDYARIVQHINQEVATLVAERDLAASENNTRLKEEALLKQQQSSEETEKRSQQLEEALRRSQLKTAEAVQQKYITDIYLQYLKQFVFNQDVLQQVHAYCTTVSALFENEKGQRNIKDLIQSSVQLESVSPLQGLERDERETQLKLLRGMLSEHQSDHAILFAEREELKGTISKLLAFEQKNYTNKSSSTTLPIEISPHRELTFSSFDNHQDVSFCQQDSPEEFSSTPEPAVNTIGQA